MQIAIVEKITNAKVIGRKRFHVTYFTYFTMTNAADVSDSSPERVTASAYDGIRKGRAVMMNMPNPNPMVRCMKLAPAASRNMGSICMIFCDLFALEGNYILDMMSVREHVHRSYSSDFVVLAEDFQVTSL